jgi:hypothetical protein
MKNIIDKDQNKKLGLERNHHLFYISSKIYSNFYHTVYFQRNHTLN